MIFSIFSIFRQILNFVLGVKGVLAFGFVLLAGHLDLLIVVFEVQINFSLNFAHLLVWKQRIVDV